MSATTETFPPVRNDARNAPPALPDDAPTPDTVKAARTRIEGAAVLTPLLNSPFLDEMVGGKLFVKAEPLQRTGSFKFRGAYNKISQIPEADRGRGVVAFSSGNHAQGVAHAAQLLGIRATIVMPADAPAMKLANTKAYGAEVVTYDRYNEDREQVAAGVLERTGGTLVKPFDDRDTIAGQGTIGYEIAEQAAAAGVKPDQVIVCCGGGGLISGCATALSDVLPGVPVYSAEPAGFDDTARSLVAGERLENDPANRSVCDALLAERPGALTFAVNSRLLAGGTVVTDREVFIAMRHAFERLKLVVEPGGAVALASALFGRIETKGRTTVVVASGGNVDGEMFGRALAAV
jgi:threonine dehydratase